MTLTFDLREASVSPALTDVETDLESVCKERSCDGSAGKQEVIFWPFILNNGNVCGRLRFPPQL